MKKYIVNKTFLKVILCCNVMLFSGIFGFSQSQKILKNIVIDAGHGGRDPGALGFVSREKDIALSVSLKVGKLIKDSLPDLKVFYTRTTDEYPPLKERGVYANKVNGDFLISIHVNATAGRRERVHAGYRYQGKGKKRKKVAIYKTVVHKETYTSGTETYVLGLSRNDEKEKAIVESGETINEEEGMLDESDPTTKMIIAQYSQKYLLRSANFAGKVQQEYAKIGRRDLGVKQKSLQVLANSAMPGVLTELGFINNREEEAFLNSEAGQRQMAYCIFRALKAYKQEIEEMYK